MIIAKSIALRGTHPKGTLNETPKNALKRPPAIPQVVLYPRRFPERYPERCPERYLEREFPRKSTQRNV